MDQKEYEALLASIERMIEASLRGYRRGNHFQIVGRLEETAQEQERLYSGSGDDTSMRLPAGIAEVPARHTR